MADNLVLAEQRAVSFYVEDLGAYAMELADQEGFDLAVGQPYTVRFDGTDYLCVCFDAGALNAGMVGLGNGAPFGLPGNGEPFAVSYIAGTPPVVFCFRDTQATEHTIAISAQGEAPKILLADHTGKTVEYSRPDRLRLDNSSGGTEDYIHGRLVAEPVEKTVELDFSGGDMVLAPGAGQAFSAVNIPMPGNLTPENIAKGVDIAGIVGTMASGGGGDFAFSMGTITPTSDGVTTITHDLGVVPDIFFVGAQKAVSGTYAILSTCNFSKAFMEKTGNKGWLSAGSITSSVSTADGALDGSDCGFGMPHNATASTVDVGDTMYLQSGKQYAWVAVGGLS